MKLRNLNALNTLYAFSFIKNYFYGPMEECKLQENGSTNKETLNDTDCFNTFSNKMLITKYSSLDDSTPVIISLIQKLPSSKTNKLIKIILSLTNYKIEEVQKLTLDRHRKIRFVSTQVIYKYILHNYKSNNFTEINILFKNTFLKRYKDVDPAIRAISYTFLINFVKLNPKLFNKHKLLVKQGLRDRNDIVRKAIISEIRLVNLDIENSLILDICKYDKNKIIRIESYKLIFENYLEDKMIDESDILESLKINEGDEKIDNKDFNILLQKVFIKMLENNFIDMIHKIYQNCQEYLNLVDINESFICDCPQNCYLKILEIKKTSLKVSDLYEIYKNNLNSLDSITILLSYADIDNTEVFIRFLDDLFKNITVKKDIAYFENLCQFFKNIENDYKSIIENILNRINNDIEYRYVIIKYFDISDFITDDDYLETRIYKSLWDILNENYYKLKKLSDDQKYKNKKEVCNLLLMIKDKLKKNVNQSYIQDAPFDNLSSLNILYFDLVRIIKNLLDDPILLYHIYKFNEEGILEDQIYYLYRHVDNSSTFSDMFSRSHNKKNLVRSYFRYIVHLSEEDTDRDILILEIGKLINFKYRDTSDGFYFKNIKNVIEIVRSCEVYKYLELFVSKLNVNECIVLENICEDSKFKQSLVKKIDKTKVFKSSEDNVTYL
jgi:hypothetical protein